MGLKHLKLPEARVELADGEHFAVRGLSLNDIAVLVVEHGPKLGELYDQFVALGGEPTTDALVAFAAPVLHTAPEIAAQLIAAAAGDAEDVDVAARLPFPVQLDALEKLVKLTFDAGGGAKKVMETVVRLAASTNSLLAVRKT